jgi:hypothetical protein
MALLESGKPADAERLGRGHHHTRNPANRAGKLPDNQLHAATMYCLGALQFFKDKSRDEIFQVVSEIAVIGENGLDYSNPDTVYTLNTIPDKPFSGLQMIAYMFVGFKRVNPHLDIGMDLRDAYSAALQLFNMKEKP